MHARTASLVAVTVVAAEGKPIFVEPMLTKTMLLEKASFELPVPPVPGMTPAPPRAFRAEYDAQANAYRFTFSGFGSAN